MNHGAWKTYHPWPIQAIRERLCSDDTLWQLCHPKGASGGHDIREIGVEKLMAALLTERFGRDRVTVRKPIGRTLGLRSAPFPARTLPDIVLNLDGFFHVCELKSSRTDHSRFDDVCDSRLFKEYLASVGHDGPAPWEVEQDLIKLRLYHGLSDQVGSSLFLMVDAYRGTGRSWARVFSDAGTFLSTMRTNLVRGWVKELLASTSVEPIASPSVEAALVVCEVGPATG